LNIKSKDSIKRKKTVLFRQDHTFYLVCNLSCKASSDVLIIVVLDFESAKAL